MKKYLILLSSIFIFLICSNKVNAAYTGTLMTEDTDYITSSINYERQVQDQWYYVGDFYSQMTYAGTGGSVSNIAIYLNAWNHSVIGFKFGGAIHTLDDLQVVEFLNLSYNNVAIYSLSSASFPFIFLSAGDLPTFGGSCSNGSYCFNFINSGNQGNGYSAVFTSNNILFSYFYYGGQWTTGGNPYQRFYDFENGVTWAGTGSPSVNISTTSCQNFMATQDIKNTSNYTYTNACFHRFELQEPVPSDPDYTLDIEEGSERGKALVFRFSNFDEESEIHINNLTTGDTYNEWNLSTNNTYIVDNISLDSVFYYEIYNAGELVFSDTIDVYSNYLADDVPLTVIEQNSYLKQTELRYVNLKSDYKVYYAINNGSFINIDDNPENLQTYHSEDDAGIIFTNTGVRENNNYVLIARITDVNDNLLYEKSYNIVYFQNKPYFTFKSSYNSNTGGNDITITYHNFQNNDVLYYSFDNSTWMQFTNINVNKLEVFSNVNIYTKAVRGNETYYGFYQVNLYEYDNSINDINNNPNGYDDTNLLTSFKNVFSGVDLSFLNNVSIFWNQLKSSMIFKYILLMCIGSMILFILRLIRR